MPDMISGVMLCDITSGLAFKKHVIGTDVMLDITSRLKLSLKIDHVMVCLHFCTTALVQRNSLGWLLLGKTD